MKKPWFSKGFTLPELLVSLFIFSLAILGAVSLLISAIGVQRRAGAQQELMDQASYLAEYMSRALRQAQKDLTGSCLTVSGAGFNYEITQGGQGIKFINRLGQCQEFFLDVDAQRLKERISPQESYITSDNLKVTLLGFNVSGAGQGDDLQPRATFAIELNGEVRIQTTVSQRKIDVPE